MYRREALVYIRGAKAKLTRFQTLITEYYKDETFDTKEHEAQAFALLDEISDIINAARNEL
jgi:hypothetical protein